MIPLTPWVRRLLFLNVGAFFVSLSLPPELYQQLVYHPLRLYVNVATDEQIVRPDLIYKPWTVVTYMFLHDRSGFSHLFFNMIGLYFFGPRLEERLGGADFLKLYLLSGLGGAVFSFFAPQSGVIGASGAVYGVLLAYALYWPRQIIYLMLFIPVEAWLLAVLLVAGSLWSGITGTGAGVAHFAHLGGLAFAYAYLKVRDWRKGSAKREFKKKLEATPGAGGGSLDRGALRRWETIDVAALHELNRDEVLVLLEKARTVGVKELSVSERQFLDRMSAATGP